MNDSSGTATAKEVYRDAIIAGVDLPPGSQMHLPVGVNSTLQPGYISTQKGTCVRKPLRSSVEEEAKYGKLEYITKDEPNSAEALNRKQRSLEEEVKELQATIKGLVIGLQGGQQTAPQPVKDISELGWNEVRTKAKEKGISTYQKSRKEVEEELRGNS